MLSSRVSLAVAIPQTFLDGRVDPARLRRFLVRAEALGFSGAWVVEQVIGTAASLGPIECLTYAAAVTERMRLGVAVLLTALRSPIPTWAWDLGDSPASTRPSGSRRSGAPRALGKAFG